MTGWIPGTEDEDLPGGVDLKDNHIDAEVRKLLLLPQVPGFCWGPDPGHRRLPLGYEEADS